jgi:hypothetical protein
MTSKRPKSKEIVVKNPCLPRNWTHFRVRRVPRAVTLFLVLLVDAQRWDRVDRGDPRAVASMAILRLTQREEP